eukprot:3934408-Rhodomonas_salina.3
MVPRATTLSAACHPCARAATSHYLVLIDSQSHALGYHTAHGHSQRPHVQQLSTLPCEPGYTANNLWGLPSACAIFCQTLVAHDRASEVEDGASGLVNVDDAHVVAGDIAVHKVAVMHPTNGLSQGFSTR